MLIVLAFGSGGIKSAQDLVSDLRLPGFGRSSSDGSRAPSNFPVPALVADDPDRAAFAKRYGTFDSFTKSGTSDAEIELPGTARAGMATVTYDGQQRFRMEGIDADGDEHRAPEYYSRGSWKGALKYGDQLYGAKTVKISVSADGPWTIKLDPLYSAPELTLPASGTGPAVFLYRGGATDWRVTHSGSSNFMVWDTFADGKNDLLVNEIGDYSKTMPAPDGPVIVSIQADGDWTITAP